MIILQWFLIFFQIYIYIYANTIYSGSNWMFWCYWVIDSVTNSAVHQSDSLRKETVHVSGCFGVQSSIAPTGGEKLEQVVSRM